MRSLVATVTVAISASMGWAPSALAAEQSPKASPLDFQACNFRSGKGMADLDKVSEEFREYVNKNDFAYSAWTLTPQYYSGAGFDVGWLGAWPDGVSYGVSEEKWRNTGGDIAAKFNQVLDCGGRQLAFSWPISAPEGTPADGVLLVYECALEEGKTLQDAYAAHMKWGTAKKGLGYLDNSWMWIPAVGVGDIDFDYRHAVVFYRYSDMGDTMEKYANEGGIQAREKILGGISSCKTPTILDALSVRAVDER
jgi:hypothetical protein